MLPWHIGSMLVKHLPACKAEFLKEWKYFYFFLGIYSILRF